MMAMRIATPAGVLALCMAVLPSAAAGQGDKTCPSSQNYQGRKVTRVRVTSPFAFFPAASYGFQQLAASLPLKEGDQFSASAFSKGAGIITTTVRTGFVDGFSAMRFVATLPQLENCTADTVEIHYVVYSSVFPPLFGQSFVVRQGAVEKPATTGGSLGTQGRFLIVPDVGYNHTRRGYAGGLIQSETPVYIFDHIKLQASASSNSLLGNIDLSGKRMLAKHYLDRAEWHFSSTYRDLPAGDFRLKEAKLAASFFAQSKEIAPGKPILHYAVSLAGGHQQGTTLDASNSPYGDLKAVGGLESQYGASAFSGSYGLQLGSTLNDRTVDFAKHIVDLRYNLYFSPLPRFLKTHKEPDDRAGFIGKTHKPFSLEGQANAGIIQTFGVVPAAERFFGGNRESAPFIENQPWDVREEPYIRSIPENQIGSINPAFGVGGTRFYSLNMTLAKVVAGEALLPRELNDQGFVDALDAGIDTAKLATLNTYLAQDPEVVKAREAAKGAVTALANEVRKLKTALPSFSFGPPVDAKIAGVLKDLKTKTISTIAITEVILKGNATRIPYLMDTLTPALLADLEKIKAALTAPEHAAAAANIGALQDELQAALDQLKKDWVPNPAARARASAKADQDLATAENVLNTLLYQLNIYSVAPVGIFDVARVWPSGVGVRYGVGGGVRVSLATANFTVGYAANPVRSNKEGPGALFFKLDVTNIFH
jgi:hypothetical protein